MHFSNPGCFHSDFQILRCQCHKFFYRITILKRNLSTFSLPIAVSHLVRSQQCGNLLLGQSNLPAECLKLFCNDVIGCSLSSPCLSWNLGNVRNKWINLGSCKFCRQKMSKKLFEFYYVFRIGAGASVFPIFVGLYWNPQSLCNRTGSLRNLFVR